MEKIPRSSGGLELTTLGWDPKTLTHYTKLLPWPCYIYICVYTSLSKVLWGSSVSIGVWSVSDCLLGILSAGTKEKGISVSMNAKLETYFQELWRQHPTELLERSWHDDLPCGWQGSGSPWKDLQASPENLDLSWTLLFFHSHLTAWLHHWRQMG